MSRFAGVDAFPAILTRTFRGAQVGDGVAFTSGPSRVADASSFSADRPTGDALAVVAIDAFAGIDDDVASTSGVAFGADARGFGSLGDASAFSAAESGAGIDLRLLTDVTKSAVATVIVPAIVSRHLLQAIFAGVTWYHEERLSEAKVVWLTTHPMMVMTSNSLPI